MSLMGRTMTEKEELFHAPSLVLARGVKWTDLNGRPKMRCKLKRDHHAYQFY